MARKSNKRLAQSAIGVISAGIVLVAGYYGLDLQEYINNSVTTNTPKNVAEVSFSIDSIPDYNGEPYVIINDNIPAFAEEDYTKGAFEEYSELDSLGRCGIAYANICKEVMPAEGEKRGEIGMIKPSGWQTVRYNGIVDGNYLYNRCHLIGWQLAGENANKRNLITGTRYMNVEGMLPFENMVDDYLEQEENQNNHVLYRVTPIFEGNNLVASGVEIEAYSIEDKGKGICFNVYVYNVQSGIKINYANGESKLEKE